jgi:hypothetical protein
LRQNPDVAAANINPLVHYALAGRQEGRKAKRALDVERLAIEASRSPMAWMGDASERRDPDPDIGADAFFERISAEPPTSFLVVAISHDDHVTGIGGTQNLIRDEQMAFRRLGALYIHLAPSITHPYLSSNSKHAITYSVRIASEHMGLLGAGDLLAVLARVRRQGRQLLVVVHHLLHHAPEVVRELALLSSGDVIAWEHDFFSVCPNYALLRNDVRYCGAPPRDSAACGVCVYGVERNRVERRIRAFFEGTRPWVLAPSEMALRLWLKSADLPHRGADVHPLAGLVLDYDDVVRRPHTARPLRIAHIGARTLVKGWSVFEQLAERFGAGARYRFFQLCHEEARRLKAVTQIPVRVTGDDPDAMIDAIAENGIDVVISWSAAMETFCYAVHEAIAAGAFVVTRSNAGNVPAIVECYEGRGIVLPDESALDSLFETSELETMVWQSTRRRGVLVPQGGAAGWLARSADGRRILRGLRGDGIVAASPALETTAE